MVTALPKQTNLTNLVSNQLDYRVTVNTSDYSGLHY